MDHQSYLLFLIRRHLNFLNRIYGHIQFLHLYLEEDEICTLVKEAAGMLQGQISFKGPNVFKV